MKAGETVGIAIGAMMAVPLLYVAVSLCTYKRNGITRAARLRNWIWGRPNVHQNPPQPPQPQQPNPHTDGPAVDGPAVDGPAADGPALSRASTIAVDDDCTPVTPSSATG